MTTKMSFLMIILGCVLEVIAFVSKHFYAAKGIYGGATDKEVPRWIGRLLFASGGAVFIAIGIARLLLDA